MKPGQCVRQCNSVSKAHSLLWLRSEDPPTPSFFIHVADGTSRLINSEPTGESAAAQICIHLSEPSGRAHRGRDAHSCPSRHVMVKQWTPNDRQSRWWEAILQIQQSWMHLNVLYVHKHKYTTRWNLTMNYIYIFWQPCWFLCETCRFSSLRHQWKQETHKADHQQLHSDLCLFPPLTVQLNLTCTPEVNWPSGRRVRMLVYPLFTLLVVLQLLVVMFFSTYLWSNSLSLHTLHTPIHTQTHTQRSSHW